VISVVDALAHLRGVDMPLISELTALPDLLGRVLAADVTANITQPPFAASAMDGYAVRLCDIYAAGAQLTVIGEAPAGQPFEGEVAAGQAVRLFTGSVIPSGADTVIIQENVTRQTDIITVDEPQSSARHIRYAGGDFHAGQCLAQKGTRLNGFHGTLFAAANVAAVPCYSPLRVALFANGDELAEPGDVITLGQVINSNHYGLSHIIEDAGAVPHYLGRAGDTVESVQTMFEKGRMANVIVPIGGASVGDYDVVKKAFIASGGEMIFSKIAVRPGKPTWFGKIGKRYVLGLPGNPASALVCAQLFLRALLRAEAPCIPAILTEDIGANGGRESYMRGQAALNETGQIWVLPESRQDSALLSPFTEGNCLIKRVVRDGARNAGDSVQLIPMRPFF